MSRAGAPRMVRLTRDRVMAIRVGHPKGREAIRRFPGPEHAAGVWNLSSASCACGANGRIWRGNDRLASSGG
jgi:hypothetical protein